MNIQETYNWAKATKTPLEIVKARLKGGHQMGWHFMGKGNRAQRRRGFRVNA